MSTHLHTPLNSGRLLSGFLWAALPAALIGVWNLGYQLLTFAPSTAPSALALAGLEPDPASLPACLLVGSVYGLPLLAVATATSWLWAHLFARLRREPIDAGWFMMAWLFALLLPPSTSLLAAALAMSFGAVVGAHIFGGSGRYLASPALLGALFLQLSYPDFVGNPLPDVDAARVSDWHAIATSGGATTESLVPYLWGREIGALGASSAIACLLGALALIRIGVVSWRVIAGGATGVIGTALFLNLLGDSQAAQLPWYWHLGLGNIAFVLAFIITDPSAAPLTRPARWLLGLAVGSLTVLIRTLDPAQPEATLVAALLGMLAVPLFDYLVIRRHWLEPGRS